MSLVRDAFTVIKEHRRTFIVFNVVFYGLFVATMIVTAAVYPEAQVSAVKGVQGDLNQPGLGSAVAAGYDSGNILWAAGVTLFVNFFIGALLTTTLPSLIIPFFGIAFTVYRVTQWGILFVPLDGNYAAFIPHLVTLIVEGQAYLIAAFAVWIHGRKFLRPGRFSLPTRRAGYKAGLKDTLRLYPLVVMLLIIGAIYEAIEVIHLIPLFSESA
ncbi:hypothetical protein [Streptosporangium longisporum]|uniref:Stage II sporulation protein M n=1 Tax=Streptosporangium longisporum TaxID=46187 RepID=A0ABP6K6K2_9ACTN